MTFRNGSAKTNNPVKYWEPMSDFVYTPSGEKLRNTNIFKFAERNGFSEISALYDKADLDQKWFWNSVVGDLGIVFSTPYSEVIDASAGKERTLWYTGGHINAVDTCILKHTSTDRTAISYERENGESGKFSFSQLEDLTSRMAGSLIRLGVKKGDRVGIYMPLNPECVIAMYSIMRIGAVAVPIFSGYGADAVETRIRDAGTGIVFVSGYYERKGNPVRMVETLRKAGKVRKIVHRGSVLLEDEFDFDELLKGERFEGCEDTLSEDPAIMLYTSGTTGKPKGTVHVHGGAFVNIVKEVKYYMDMHPDDVLYWITDIGWMMGPWAIMGANAVGGTIFLYDGAVDFPDEKRIWNMIKRNGITLLGLSPTFVRTMKHRGISDRLNGIRVFGSTGEPWDDESWMWLFEKYGGSETPIANISGGTDIIGCFLASTPAVPLKPRCLYRGLGMNVSVFNEQGEEVYDQIGYLVAKEHCPSMTRGIWKNNEKYIDTYWSRFGDTWNHGDWAMMDHSGYFYLFGRADDVMKVAGKRVGPNEVENVVSRVPGVSECAVVGIPDRIKGEAAAVFYTGDSSNHVSHEIEMEVVRSLGKSFRPVTIHVKTLPKTKNGKIMRRVLKNAFLGKNAGDVSGLEDQNIIIILRNLGEGYIDDEGFLRDRK